MLIFNHSFIDTYIHSGDLLKIDREVQAEVYGCNTNNPLFLGKNRCLAYDYSDPFIEINQTIFQSFPMSVLVSVSGLIWQDCFHVKNLWQTGIARLCMYMEVSITITERKTRKSSIYRSSKTTPIFLSSFWYSCV